MTDRVYEKRFSERGAFWGLCAALLSAVVIYIYIKIFEESYFHAAAGGLWVALCAAAAAMTFAARRTNLLARRPKLRLFADWTGGLWLGFVMWTFAIFMILTAADGLLGLGLTDGTGAARALAASFAAAFCVVAAGVYSALHPGPTFIKIETDKLPPDAGRLRIVQLTDLHLGPSSGAFLLARVLRRVREAKPDMVVVTGDVTDGSLEGRRRETAMFRRLKPKYGVFAVTGNHDFYDDIEESLKCMRMSGMKVLRGEAVEAGGIVVEGDDDGGHLAEHKWGLTRSETLIVNTKSRFRDKFILLLRHRPVVEIGTEGFFDLQLSGHTHGGQVFPMFSSRLFVRGHSRGLKKLKRGSLLYTSNGAGYVGPPVRLMAPPEIVVIDIVRKEGAPGAASAR